MEGDGPSTSLRRALYPYKTKKLNRPKREGPPHALSSYVCSSLPMEELDLQEDHKLSSSIDPR